MEKKLKKIIVRYKGQIKSIWSVKREINFLVKGKQKEIETYARRVLKGHKIKTYILKDYFENIFEGQIDFYQSLTAAEILYDPNAFIDPIKKIASTGKISGTKESYLLKFMKISDHFKNINKIKYDVLNNIILLVVESSQAALLQHADKIPPLKKVPDYLEAYLLPKGLEERYIGWSRKAINMYREIEHGKRGLPSGQELDDMQKKAEEFRERINILLPGK